jgi:hypothetical protein
MQYLAVGSRLCIERTAFMQPFSDVDDVLHDPSGQGHTQDYKTNVQGKSLVRVNLEISAKNSLNGSNQAGAAAVFGYYVGSDEIVAQAGNVSRPAHPGSGFGPSVPHIRPIRNLYNRTQGFGQVCP